MLAVALKLRVTRVTAVLMTLLGIGLAAVPLFGAHGPESALVLGVLLPPWAAAIGARLVMAPRRQLLPPRPMQLVGASVMTSWLCLALPTLLLAANALRVKNCDPWGGLMYMLLGPWMGSALAATAGVVVAILVPRPRWATALAVGLPLGTIAYGLLLFYSTPAIFAYGHFFGYFPGTLYDLQIDFPTAFLSFRLVTLGLWATMCAGLVALYDPIARRPRWRSLRMGRGRKSWLTAAIVVGVACGLAEYHGPRLGHRTSAAWIAESLGGQLENERCVLVYPGELDRVEAERLHADCTFRVDQMQRLFGVRQPRPVTAYLFRSSDEKRRLMGAGNIYIAKPWRDEVYLQVQAWPHPVFAHEIAHVVAGNFGAGPFRVAAHLGGLWPNPALIEGLAVAAAWSVHDGLTPHQWARAMLDLGMAPPLSTLMGANFLAQPKGQAYTLSGSFVRYVLDTYGRDSVRRLYALNNATAALGRSFTELEQAWHDYLAEVPLPESALALAQARFERVGVLSAICPHEVASLEQALGAQMSAADHGAAATTCQRILTIDPSNARIRTSLVHALARSGQDEDALAELQVLSGPKAAPLPLIASAQEAMADAAWRRGQRDQARQILGSLLDQPLSSDARRQVEVKHQALVSDDGSADLIFELLVGERKHADPVTAMHLVRELAQLRHDGLAPYFEGRQLFFRQQFARSAALLEQARTRGLFTDTLQREALRMEGIARFAQGALGASEQLWHSYAHGRLATPGTQAEARDWLERIEYQRRSEPGQTPDGLL